MQLPASLLVEAGLRGGFVSLMGLLAWRLVRLRPAAAAAPAIRLGLLMVLGSAAYAVQAPHAADAALGQLAAWQWPLQVVMNGNPVVMWLLACALFDDAFRLRPWHAALWLAWVGLGVGNCAVWHRPVLGLLAASGPVLFSLAALWPMLRFWRDDLVEQRIRWRLRILGVVMAYSVLSAVAGIPSPAAAASPLLGLLDAAALLVVGAVAAAALLDLRPGFWLQQAPSPGPAAQGGEPEGAPGGSTDPGALPDGPAVLDGLTPDEACASPGAHRLPAAETPADPGALARLNRAMQDEQVFRREGLTIGVLAAQLGLPEYRLRRVINGELGHRNFNAYLNAHRIAWARAALADPARAGEPVLGIALEAGFQSLGPFNRAFKADTGLTPTEFRARALAESR